MEEADDGANEDGTTSGAVAVVLDPRSAHLPSLPFTRIPTSCKSQ